MRVYLAPKVLIIDEMGYLPLDDMGATIFFRWKTPTHPCVALRNASPKVIAFEYPVRLLGLGTDHIEISCCLITPSVGEVGAHA